MSKRAAPEDSTQGSPYAKAPVGGAKREDENGEMGQFEDAYDDEIESDEDAVDGGENGEYQYDDPRHVQGVTEL
jgi:ribosome assembly protein RRB1